MPSLFKIWDVEYQNVTKHIFLPQEKAIRAVDHLDFNALASDSYLNMKTLKLEDLYIISINI